MADTDLKQFFFDVAELPGLTIAEMAAGREDAEQMFDLFGRDLLTKTIVSTPQYAVFHETAPPGTQVKPHRHGTHQLNFLLHGELFFGNRRLTAGMGFFSPDALYAWRAGDEGAEWIEIHFGQPGTFTDRRVD